MKTKTLTLKTAKKIASMLREELGIRCLDVEVAERVRLEDPSHSTYDYRFGGELCETVPLSSASARCKIEETYGFTIDLWIYADDDGRTGIPRNEWSLVDNVCVAFDGVEWILCQYPEGEKGSRLPIHPDNRIEEVVPPAHDHRYWEHVHDDDDEEEDESRDLTHEEADAISDGRGDFEDEPNEQRTVVLGRDLRVGDVVWCSDTRRDTVRKIDIDGNEFRVQWQHGCDGRLYTEWHLPTSRFEVVTNEPRVATVLPSVCVSWVSIGSSDVVEHAIVFETMDEADRVAGLIRQAADDYYKETHDQDEHGWCVGTFGDIRNGFRIEMHREFFDGPVVESTATSYLTEYRVRSLSLLIEN